MVSSKAAAKDQAIPSKAIPYCLDCGRLMPSDHRPDPTPRKYCSGSCRDRAKDRARRPARTELGNAFQRLMDDGKPNRVVLCSEAERAVFTDPETAPSDVREEARRAARRLVAFGWPPEVIETRPVQAVQDGKPVDTSTAKGEWGIRWSQS